MKVNTVNTFAGASSIEMSYDGLFPITSNTANITPIRRGVADVIVVVAGVISAYIKPVTELNLVSDAQVSRFKILLDRLYEECEFNYSDGTVPQAKLVESRFVARQSEFSTGYDDENSKSGIKRIGSPLGATIEFFEGTNDLSKNLRIVEEIANQLFPILCTDRVAPELPFFSAHGLRVEEDVEESFNYVPDDDSTEL